ncbi:thiamine diphosphate-binding protein [Mrakia frigida]|uniref:alpha-keto acid decarboxylase family protein n=1 Tax=Mrakia frigida TaxID=29902 RepID=UPI003FCC24DD
MTTKFSGDVTITDYILARLTQLGVKTIFGVPGDFNLEMLDYIEDNKDILWAGNANELNAAYAADGYARVSKGLAVLLTTFGVGELSALNGVAGMMAERLPLLHIVGMPSTKLQSSRALLHHTLGDGRFNEFELMSGQITAHTARLQRAEGAGELIDELIKVALKECRPVYLAFPTDLNHVKIPADRLNTLLPSPASSPPPASAADVILEGPGKAFVDTVVALYEKAVDPVVLVDACAGRFGMEGWALKLVEDTGMSFFETPMGKASTDETHPQYAGCYIGSNSFPAVQALVEKSDLVISLGAIISDFNSGSFSWGINKNVLVELHSDHMKVGHATYPALSFRDILPVLAKQLAALPKKAGSSQANTHDAASIAQRYDAVVVPTAEDEADEAKFGKGIITQKYLWPRMQHFFKEWDVILADTGTSAFGILDIPFPKTAIALSQVLWGSIGWSVGATLGAAQAARESKQGADRRTILFVGDGSLQLTVQEIGTMMRRGLTPFIFVLNNDGYEIERQIHGVNAIYNDIQPYNHSLLLDFLSPPPSANQLPYPKKFHKVSTRDELDALLKDPEFQAGKVIQLIEIMMPRHDAPRSLLTQAKLTEAINNTL